MFYIILEVIIIFSYVVMFSYYSGDILSYFLYIYMFLYYFGGIYPIVRIFACFCIILVIHYNVGDGVLSF